MAKLNDSRVRPADVCKALLAALEAADGRRRSRKRDQTPDMIGITLKRELLERAVRDNPDPELFEQWLLNSVESCPGPRGAAIAMARSIFDEWKLSRSMPEFNTWLQQGAPSEDAGAGPAVAANRIDEASLRQHSGAPADPPMIHRRPDNRG